MEHKVQTKPKVSVVKYIITLPSSSFQHTTYYKPCPHKLQAHHNSSLTKPSLDTQSDSKHNPLPVPLKLQTSPKFQALFRKQHWNLLAQNEFDAGSLVLPAFLGARVFHSSQDPRNRNSRRIRRWAETTTMPSAKNELPTDSQTMGGTIPGPELVTSSSICWLSPVPSIRLSGNPSSHALRRSQQPSEAVGHLKGLPTPCSLSMMLGSGVKKGVRMWSKLWKWSTSSWSYMLDTSDPDRLETLLGLPRSDCWISELGDATWRISGLLNIALPSPPASFVLDSFFVFRKRPPEPLARRSACRWRDSWRYGCIIKHTWHEC